MLSSNVFKLFWINACSVGSWMLASDPPLQNKTPGFSKSFTLLCIVKIWMKYHEQKQLTILCTTSSCIWPFFHTYGKYITITLKWLPKISLAPWWLWVFRANSWEFTWLCWWHICRWETVITVESTNCILYLIIILQKKTGTLKSIQL